MSVTPIIQPDLGGLLDGTGDEFLAGYVDAVRVGLQKIGSASIKQGDKEIAQNLTSRPVVVDLPRHRSCS